MKTLWLAILASVALSASAHTAKTKICNGFLPENTMNIPVNDARPMSDMTEAAFNEMMDKLQAEYGPEIQKLGARFSIERNWKDGTVNAYAYREGRDWIISMFGGFARHPKVTADAFLGVACHEVGHHLGGTPTYAGDWASVEGQSDYYSTLKCLRRMFAKDDNKKILDGMTLNPTAVSQCEAQHSGQQDQLICIRSVMAALSLAELLAELEKGSVPTLETPDPKEVRRTDPDHPAGQCRVDTLFNAATCPVPVNEKLSNSDYRQGTCYTPEHSKGFRPRCWFAPPKK